MELGNHLNASKLLSAIAYGEGSETIETAHFWEKGVE